MDGEGGGGHMITQATQMWRREPGAFATVRQPEMIRTLEAKIRQTSSTLPDGTKTGFFWSHGCHSGVFPRTSWPAFMKAAAERGGVMEGFIRGSPKTTAQTNLRRRAFANPPEMLRHHCFFCSLFTCLLLFLTARQRRTFCRKAPGRTIRAGSLQESARL